MDVTDAGYAAPIGWPWTQDMFSAEHGEVHPEKKAEFDWQEALEKIMLDEDKIKDGRFSRLLAKIEDAKEQRSIEFRRNPKYTSDPTPLRSYIADRLLAEENIRLAITAYTETFDDLIRRVKTKITASIGAGDREKALDFLEARYLKALLRMPSDSKPFRNKTLERLFNDRRTVFYAKEQQIKFYDGWIKEYSRQERGEGLFTKNNIEFQYHEIPAAGAVL